jgi:AcrR family transcriptional regulator
LPKNAQVQAAPHGGQAEGKVEKALGPKGARTRRRIMDATADMLAERPFADIRITEVARAADIAQPNFYTYFASVEDVILAIADEVSADSLSVYLEPDWEGEAGLEHARQLVEAAIKLWRRHRGVFSIVSMLADKRHGGFAAVRVRQMRVIYKSFETKIRAAQRAGRLDTAITPRLCGYECVGIIGSTGQRYELLIASGFTHEQLVETTARLLHLIATGARV